MSEVPFGKPFRAKYFKSLYSKVFPVNHGSSGVTPDPVIEKYIEAIREDYQFPDRFIRLEQKLEYSRSLKELAKVLGADYRNLAFVDNATLGANTVLRSLPFAQGDKIVFPSTVFDSCENTVKFLESRHGVVPLLVQLDYPLSDDEVVAKFEEVFKRESPKLALFDTIISMPGIRVPFERLVQLCRKYGVLSLVDGAHGAGLIPLHLDSLDADFFVSNLHKWFYVPRGCAVLYVAQRHHRKVHSLPISHSYLDDSVVLDPSLEATRLVDRFAFVGTKNFASVSVIPDVIRFRQEVCGGEQAIWDYCHSLALNVAAVVSEKWGTSILGPVLGVTTMINVEVPVSELGVDVAVLTGPSKKKCLDYYYAQLFTHNTFVPYVVHNGKLYMRFSAQLYNELSDYEYAADAVIKVLKKLVKSPAYLE
jgi:selenocysteine lyase/cysteine desulfurase